MLPNFQNPFAPTRQPSSKHLRMNLIFLTTKLGALVSEHLQPQNEAFHVFVIHVRLCSQIQMEEIIWYETLKPQPTMSMYRMENWYCDPRNKKLEISTTRGRAPRISTLGGCTNARATLVQ